MEDFQETLGWQTSLRHSCQFFCEIDPLTNAEVVQYREETELTVTYVPEEEKTTKHQKMTTKSQIFILSIYTLSDLGDSSNLIGSLSRTMTF